MPAVAQDKAAPKMEKAKAGEVVIKEISQNDKLRVYEATFKPGDTGANATRPLRAVYAISGGEVRANIRGREEGGHRAVVHLLVVQPK